MSDWALTALYALVAVPFVVWVLVDDGDEPLISRLLAWFLRHYYKPRD